jgi:hypothetical protein
VRVAAYQVEAVPDSEAGRRFGRVESGRRAAPGRLAELGAICQQRGDVPVEVGDGCVVALPGTP